MIRTPPWRVSGISAPTLGPPRSSNLVFEAWGYSAPSDICMSSIAAQLEHAVIYELCVCVHTDATQYLHPLRQGISVLMCIHQPIINVKPYTVLTRVIQCIQTPSQMLILVGLKLRVLGLGAVPPLSAPPPHSRKYTPHTGHSALRELPAPHGIQPLAE